MHYLAAFLLFSATFTSIISCDGWHLSKITPMPHPGKKIIFDSSNSNEFLNYAIYDQLRLLGIEIAKDTDIIKKKFIYQDIPLFRILTLTLDQDIVSIFYNDHTVEYQIVMSVNASLSIPKKGTYLIKTKSCHSFFDNPIMALAKNVEYQIIVNEAYKKTAEDLINRLNILLLKNKIS